MISSKTTAYALERAKKAGLATEVLLRKQFATMGDYDVALLELLEKYQIDLIVLAGFMTIISDNIVSHYPNQIMNIHPSLIPSFCGDGFYGLHVHEEVLKKGVKVTGATVHFVNEICDGGPIILQKSCGGTAGRYSGNSPASGDGAGGVENFTASHFLVLSGKTGSFWDAGKNCINMNFME